MNLSSSISEFSQLKSEEVLKKLETRLDGLNAREINSRQKIYGLNIIHQRSVSFITILLRQFTGNPLIIILSIATGISYSLGQHISSYYIFFIVLVSVFLGFWNEYSAEKTITNLLKKISPTTLVVRHGEKIESQVSQLTIGDIVFLSQGSIIPADLRLIDANDLEVNQSVLTGESETIYKNKESLRIHTNDFAKLLNIVFMGTSVESGSGKGVVIRIGKETEFGKIAKSLTFIKPETEFQKGLSSFGRLLVKVILILSVGIFIINTLVGHPFLDSLLFALAIAVGLTPELLPVIVTISLSHGAGKLAKKHVVAKQLISIENLGNMDILCTDKTGTLTEGAIQVINYMNDDGKEDVTVMELALTCNSAIVHHKIIGNSIDVSLWNFAHRNSLTVKKVEKIVEEPFDYNRKCMFTVIDKGQRVLIIAKGAPDTILALSEPSDTTHTITKEFVELNKDGYRVIAVATKVMDKKETYSWADVTDLNYKGYITFLDTPKLSTKEALHKLHSLHVNVKVITGDNEVITQKICHEVGMNIEGILLGSELDKLDETQLSNTIEKITIFARVSPQQKLRIIKSLQKLGHTVGFLGDGVNDIPSLHGADVGISVNSAVDVAKDAASVVLLRKSLNVLADGITEGRRTFNNTIKYILMSTSSNFGNMFSASGASFFLPFLPMTPLQVLLTNGLYDVSQISIPSDNVDEQSLLKPRHWNIDFIKNYMIFFGPISSLFDFATFGIMIYIFHAHGALFQTGWFIESVATEILVVFVIRTVRTPFYLSRPSKWLFITALSMVTIGVILPYTPLATTLGFIAPPFLYFMIIGVLVLVYLFLIEIVKNKFLKKYSL